LPEGLQLAGRKVPAANGAEVPLYSFRLPDGSEMEMVSVPAGDFVMGEDDADASDCERPKHRHSMDRPYWIGRKDVTWGQYLAFCRASAHGEPSMPFWWETPPEGYDVHPVVDVTWEDAEEFCSWANLTLPSEAEWEKAARGTDGRKWPWGNAWEPGSRCNFADLSCPVMSMQQNGESADIAFKKRGVAWDPDHSDGYAFTSPVDSFPEGASPVGALDMAGNVYQWCEDGYDTSVYARYAKGDFAPPLGGPDRVVRGGSWSADARACRSSSRSGGPSSSSGDGLGFRACLRAIP
jgi:formylglycine-generating enzyme required for sulfatase activity